jgi:hypothetical protein
MQRGCNDRDPFNSRRPSQRVTRWTLVTLLVSVPLALAIGIAGVGGFAVATVVVVPLVAVWAFHDHKRGTSLSMLPPEARTGSVWKDALIEMGLTAKALVLSMSALIAGVGIAISTTWFGNAWLCLPLGAGLVFFLRAHRGGSGFLAALSFVGIPLGWYGLVIGGLLLYRPI